MKRLGRWLLNAMTVLSLLLCVAAAGLWVFGERQWQCGSWNIRTPNGWVEMVSVLPPTDPRADGPEFRFGHEELIEVTASRVPRGLINLAGGVAGSYERTFSCALWLLLLPGALAAIRCHGWMRRRGRLYRRSVVGHCRSCRYDLTGNVSGVCPECGTMLAVLPLDVRTGPLMRASQPEAAPG